MDQELDILLHGLFHELLPFSRRCREVDCPVGSSEPQCVRGKAKREPGHGRMEHTVDGARCLALLLAFERWTPLLFFGQGQGVLIEPVEFAQGKQGSQETDGRIVEPSQRRGFGFWLFICLCLIRRW